MTLMAGLFLLGAGSMWWIKQTTLENRLNLMEYLAVETAERVAQDNEEDYKHFDRRLDDRARILQMDKQPLIFITDLEGGNLHSVPPRPGPKDGNQNRFSGTIPAEILQSKETVQKLRLNGEKIYSVKSPILSGERQTGWVVVMQTAADLSNVDQEYHLLIILLAGLGLLGWGVIYFLSKKILKPIQDVARAASMIREGNYEITLASEANELEIHELVSSFKEMTHRLQQLEQMRAELLAGVTHDLKTPVTSISGLVQAVRDGIVTGDERQEFLDITLKEVERLQAMIADLLDFNSLAAGAFSIWAENCNMNKLVQEIGRQWQITKNDSIDLKVDVPESPIFMDTDPLRLQQIMINLLNNAYQALEKKRSIAITLLEGRIDVRDSGMGIPEEEQNYVFERFFRGEKKKLKVRGLGLGLPFSKMLARALGADLILKESTQKGTTFSIIWEGDVKLK